MKDLLDLYEKSLKVTDIFPIHSVGIVTARDKLTIQWSPENVWTTVLNFSKLEKELARLAYNLGKDVRDWKVDLAQKDLTDSGLDKKKIVPILYRPFDIRYTYYTGKSRGFHCMPRRDIMRHIMAGENLSLITSRLTKGETFKHAQVSRNIVEVICMSPKTSNNGFVFPLYLYPDPDKKNLFSHIEEAKGKQPNISKKLSSALSEAYKKEPAPEEVFYYIYAVLYSNAYRTKYSEFLRVDFPRVPFTKEHKLFEEMGKCGKRLMDLHLLQSSELDPPVARFQGKGNNKVEKVKYNEKEARSYINQDQHFEGVAQEIWEYRIGGYQVCNKWLKDRKGGTLSLEDIKRYCKVATAIQRTIKVQRNIDAIYSEVEKGIIEF
jgi:predicted helicase